MTSPASDGCGKMADSNYRTTAEQNDLAQDDPFAELTRIMGHDPRSVQPVNQPAADPADDLALDLESELMGDIADEGDQNMADGQAPVAGETELGSAHDWRQPQPEVVLPHDEPGHDDPGFESSLDAMLDYAFADEGEAAEEVQALSEYPDYRNAGESEQPFLDDADFAAFDAEFSGQEAAAEEAQPETWDPSQVVEWRAGPQGGPRLEVAESAAAPADSFAGPAQSVEGWAETADEEPTADGEPAGEEDGEPARDEPEFLYAEPAREAVSYVREEASGEERAYDEPAYEEAPYQEAAYEEPAEEALVQPEEPAADLETPFDYAKAFAARPQLFAGGEADALRGEPVGQAEEPVAEGERWNAAPAWTDPEPVEEFASEDDWLQDLEAVSDRASAAEAGHQWSYQMVPEAEAAPAEEQAMEQESSFGDDYPPEIDTIDVPEGAVAVADQLDIPDIPYRDEVKPAAELDEIEEILAGAFGETADQAGEQAADSWAETSRPAEEPQTQPNLLEDDFLMAGLASTHDARPAAAAYVDEWHAADRQASSLTPAPGVEPPARQRTSRFGSPLMLAAAAVGGLVVIGGAAVFALSFGNSGEPVLVSADTSPIKVRPETPGGVQIPNQENQVYRRVSGEQANAQPAQPRLISGSEEPVNLASEDQDEVLDLGLFDDADDILPSGSAGEEIAGLEAADADERLASTEVEDRTDPGIVAVEPRRVRSFVVRPDGTMVQREAPAPAPTPVPAATETASAPAAEASQPANANEPPSAAAGNAQAPEQEAEVADAAAPTIPRTGPIPPSRPGNIATAPQQQQPVQPAEQPRTQVAALANPPAQAAAAAAPAAPASEWSVQISSQPTVESAQQSYQQLAQRFGNVLQGKGVNIVKADIEGKGTFYRVRIPSPTKDEAIRLCEQLKSAGGSCFVSK
jgi:hypothetical protein